MTDAPPALDFGTMSIGSFMAQVAAKQPVPGGGAAAGVVISLASALGEMVVNFSVGKKSFAQDQPLLEETARTLAMLRTRAIEESQADAVAYESLNRLWKLEADDPERAAHFDDAVKGAIAAPGAIMQTALELLELLSLLPKRSSKHLKSDLAIAVELATTGGRAAERNVAVNLPLLKTDSDRVALEATYGKVGESIHKSAFDLLEQLQ